MGIGGHQPGFRRRWLGQHQPGTCQRLANGSLGARSTGGAEASAGGLMFPPFGGRRRRISRCQLGRPLCRGLAGWGLLLAAGLPVRPALRPSADALDPGLWVLPGIYSSRRLEKATWEDLSFPEAPVEQKRQLKNAAKAEEQASPPRPRAPPMMPSAAGARQSRRPRPPPSTTPPAAQRQRRSPRRRRRRRLRARLEGPGPGRTRGPGSRSAGPPGRGPGAARRRRRRSRHRGDRCARSPQTSSPPQAL